MDRKQNKTRDDKPAFHSVLASSGKADPCPQPKGTLGNLASHDVPVWPAGFQSPGSQSERLYPLGSYIASIRMSKDNETGFF